MLAISLLESLKGRRLPFALEVIGFSEEEGVRFGVPFIGSRALVGRLDEELLNCAIPRIFGPKSNSLLWIEPQRNSRRHASGRSACYLEFHIEQGPVLEHRELPLGIVEAIAGQTRMELVFTGFAGHAGTTRCRCDAMRSLQPRSGHSQWKQKQSRFVVSCHSGSLGSQAWSG